MEGIEAKAAEPNEDASKKVLSCCFLLKNYVQSLFSKCEHIVTVPCNYVVNIYVKQIFEVVVVLNVEMLDDDSKWCWSETVKPC